jgi:hypothetical protein
LILISVERQENETDEEDLDGDADDDAEVDENVEDEEAGENVEDVVNELAEDFHHRANLNEISNNC